MVSKKQKKAALQEKLQLLRSVTNSSAQNKTSIILDASKYIQQLKQKISACVQELAEDSSRPTQNKTSIILDASKYIQQLKQKISACVQELAEDSSRPTVSVATLGKGLLINVSSTKSFPGMLVSILEVFENLGVEVLNANISCTDTFHLEAIGEVRSENFLR